MSRLRRLARRGGRLVNATVRRDAEEVALYESVLAEYNVRKRRAQWTTQRNIRRLLASSQFSNLGRFTPYPSDVGRQVAYFASMVTNSMGIFSDWASGNAASQGWATPILSTIMQNWFDFTILHLQDVFDPNLDVTAFRWLQMTEPLVEAMDTGTPARDRWLEADLRWEHYNKAIDMFGLVGCRDQIRPDPLSLELEPVLGNLAAWVAERVGHRVPLRVDALDRIGVNAHTVGYGHPRIRLDI